MSLLSCTGLVVGYAKSRNVSETGLIAPFDFELHSGEVVALLGENGCGKSTLLKTFAGMIPPLKGIVTLSKNESWTARERAKFVALVRMGYLANVSLDRMTVREFVGLGRTPYVGLFDGHSAEDERVVDEALKLLELENYASRWVSELSDGERSRVFLAMAVAQQVKVLLLDEPNAFLDIPHSHRLFRTLKKMAAEREMGIIVSTHSVEYAERYSDRMMVIAGGRARVAATQDARANGLLDWTEIC
ncbi:ABC transporter ATP-binding protein [uncultured Fibrobacter sp.]|uniref:ABC transporter ATP-binding protein n=1 Tax=uncultured Fibrobacter sp. TaxID=261512 RepID=UPI00261FF75C|nr:ABC transporter ATP-binding protein [uncultured Fibrobacter sp.]